MTLLQLALYEENHELLSLLMSFDYDTLNEQLGEISDRKSLTTKFMDTNNFDIWIAFALNTTLLTSHELNLRTIVPNYPKSAKLNIDMIKRNKNL